MGAATPFIIPQSRLLSHSACIRNLIYRVDVLFVRFPSARSFRIDLALMLGFGQHDWRAALSFLSHLGLDRRRLGHFQVMTDSPGALESCPAIQAERIWALEGKGVDHVKTDA